MASNGQIDTFRAEMEKIINDVAQNIGTDWKKFGRILEVPDICIQKIDVDCQKVEDKAHEVLMKWFHMHGHSGATKDVLIKALRTENNLLADEICYRHNIKVSSHSSECTAELQKKPAQQHTEETFVDHTQAENTALLQYILSLEKELASGLKNSQDNLATCNSLTLVHRQRNLHHHLNMENILFDMIKNVERKPLVNTAHLIEKAKKDCRQRIVHTEQTMRLIQYMLERITKGRKRTKSDIPRRSLSFVDLQTGLETRCYTTPGRVLSINDISSPIFIRKNKEK